MVLTNSTKKWPEWVNVTGSASEMLKIQPEWMTVPDPTNLQAAIWGRRARLNQNKEETTTRLEEATNELIGETVGRDCHECTVISRRDWTKTARPWNDFVKWELRGKAGKGEIWPFFMF